MAFLQFPESLVIVFGRFHAADGKHGIEAIAAYGVAPCFAPEIVQHILRNQFDAIGMQQDLLRVGGREFFFVLFGFLIAKPGQDVVIIHLEFQHLLIANGMGNHVMMQLRAENAGRGSRVKGVFIENRRAGKTELAKAFEAPQLNRKSVV